MKKSICLIGLIAVLALFLAGAQIFGQTTNPNTPPAPPTPKKPCCIAGTYQGTHKDNLSRTCPKPQSGDFIMEINQDQNCGSKIWGTVKDVTGESIQKFEGKVAPGNQKCCNIAGIMKKPGEETSFKGTLCLRGGKWVGQGTYKNSRGCTGKWEMKQS
jgi:hypothetical protein